MEKREGSVGGRGVYRMEGGVIYIKWVVWVASSTWGYNIKLIVMLGAGWIKIGCVGRV